MNKLTVIAREGSLISFYLGELRDKNKQTDRLRFRTNIKRISYVLAYEASKFLEYEEVKIRTPLGIACEHKIKKQPIIISVLRAGLIMHDSFLEMFDEADNAFIGSYRKYSEDGKHFEIKTEYMASPRPEGRPWIIIDPMLATGNTILQAYKHLSKFGKSSKLVVCGIIASKQAIEFLSQELPEAHFLVAGLDEELNDKGYIVPGLGDAGDLALGNKM